MPAGQVAGIGLPNPFDPLGWLPGLHGGGVPNPFGGIPGLGQATEFLTAPLRHAAVRVGVGALGAVLVVVGIVLIAAESRTGRAVIGVTPAGAALKAVGR